MITSKSNEIVKYARGLYLRKNRKKFQQFIVEGHNLIEIAKNANLIDKIISTCDVDTILVSDEVMKSIISTSSVITSIAICNMPVFENYQSDRVLVLDNIQDPGNLGTLIRSALAFDFDLVVCSNDCVDVFNEKVVRSTVGAVMLIPVIYVDLVEYLKASSNYTIGTFIDGTNEFSYHEKFNLVIGNEGHGINDNIKSLCDIKYRIDISEKIDSLNAGVAGSIIMYMLGAKYDK